MYRITDKPMAIREIQKYLLVISQNKDELTEIAVDGIYGETTRLAVSDFQINNGLDATGRVDLETFELLFREYSAILNAVADERDVILRESFPLGVGDSSDDIGILNSYLGALSNDYRDMEKPRSGNYFSPATERSVRQAEKRFGYGESGSVEPALLSRIRVELNFRKLINNLDRTV